MTLLVWCPFLLVAVCALSSSVARSDFHRFPRVAAFPTQDRFDQAAATAAAVLELGVLAPEERAHFPLLLEIHAVTHVRVDVVRGAAVPADELADLDVERAKLALVDVHRG